MLALLVLAALLASANAQKNPLERPVANDDQMFLLEQVFDALLREDEQPNPYTIAKKEAESCHNWAVYGFAGGDDINPDHIRLLISAFNVDPSVNLCQGSPMKCQEDMIKEQLFPVPPEANRRYRKGALNLLKHTGLIWMTNPGDPFDSEDLGYKRDAHLLAYHVLRLGFKYAGHHIVRHRPRKPSKWFVCAVMQMKDGENMPLGMSAAHFYLKYFNIAASNAYMMKIETVPIAPLSIYRQSAASGDFNGFVEDVCVPITRPLMVQADAMLAALGEQPSLEEDHDDRGLRAHRHSHGRHNRNVDKMLEEMALDIEKLR